MAETTSRKFDRKVENKSENDVFNPHFNSKDRNSMTPLQKHIEFFDRNKDGVIDPIDTWVGFRALGYNIVMTIIAVLMIHGTMSYGSQDSWIPDIFFRVYIKNIRRCKHGSDSQMFDYKGSFFEDRMEKLFREFSSDNNSLTLTEIWDMTNTVRNAWDFYGWFAAKFEWSFFYVLCQQEGRIYKKDILGLADGSLLYEIAKKNGFKQNKKDL